MKATGSLQVYKWLYFWLIPLDNRVTVTRKGEIAVKLNCALLCLLKWDWIVFDNDACSAVVSKCCAALLCGVSCILSQIRREVFGVCQQSFECWQLVNYLKALVNKKKVILFQTCWAKNLLLYCGSHGCSGVSHTWVCSAVSQYSVGQEAHSVR